MSYRTQLFRRLASFALVATATLPAAVLPASVAAQDFEGVITIRLTRRAPDGRPMSIDAQYFTKKGDVRLEIGAGTPNSLAGIILPGEKKVYRLISSQSLYTEQPLPDLALPAGTPAPKVVHTARKETIAGHECEHLVIISDADSVDVCMAKGLGNTATLAAALGASGTRMDAWQRTLLSDGAFPMRVTQGGAVIFDVIKVEKKFLSTTLFVVPDSYSRAPAPVRKPG